MGAAISCPQDFDTGLFFSCQSRCPSDFKYTLSGNVSAPGGQCIYLQDNSVIIDLPSLPGIEKGKPEPAVYAQERTRFSQELTKARAKIATNLQTRTQIGLLNSQRAAQAADYSRIQTEYAGYASAAGTTEVIQDVSKSLTPFRPPTAPASDIEIERKAIASINNQKLLMIQVALFIAVLVLLSYVLLPTDTAHLVALLLIAVGIASGFFLRK